MSDIAQSPKLNVLAVDDDPLTLELLKAYLEELDYEVIGENSAEHAMARLFGDMSVDILVTDVRLPGMDGLEFARIIRETKPSLPIVFISAYSIEALQGSVPGSVLLSKPFSHEQLARGINQALGTQPS